MILLTILAFILSGLFVDGYVSYIKKQMYIKRQIRNMKKGDVFSLTKKKQNPFESEEFVITILDIKDNYVKYQFDDGYTCSESAYDFFTKESFKITKMNE